MSNRPLLLATSVREIIAPVLRECPAECGIVTITTVDVSADLTFATIYISALKQGKRALAFLEERSRDLQKMMSRLETHRTPKLRFRIDVRAQEGNRIDELLKRASRNTPEDAQ